MSDNVVGIIGATVGIGRYIVNDYVITLAETGEGDGYTLEIRRGDQVQSVTLYGMTHEQYDRMVGYLAQAQSAAASAQTDRQGAEDARDAAQAAMREALRLANVAEGQASRAEQAAAAATSAGSDARAAASEAEASSLAARNDRTVAQGCATSAQAHANSAQVAQRAAESAAGNAEESAADAADAASAAAQALAGVRSEGEAQVAAIGAEGQRVMEAIPFDYTALDADVGELRNTVCAITAVERGVNHIDMTQLTAGRIDLESGEVVANSYYQTTDFCNVEGMSALAVYRLKNGAISRLWASGFTGRYAFYDAGRTFIPGSSGNNTLPDKVPENAVYIRYSFTNTMINDYDKVGLFNGDIITWTDYRPERRIAVIDHPTIVACVGDSLTSGSGGNGVSYPSVLASLLGYGYAVINDGVGGESSLEVMARQGARPARVKPFTIPASGAVTIEFASTTIGRNIGVTTSVSSRAFNPVVIAGVEGRINKSGNSYTFTRSVPGEAVAVTRDAVVYCRPMREDRDAIQVLWMGANGGWNESGAYTAQDLASQYARMVDGLTNLNRPYLVLGLHAIPGWISGVTCAEIETALEMAFGRRFINYREYIVTPITDSGGNTVSCYGLDDAGITPTAADLDAIASGTVPPSLMADDVHLNGAGYTIIGNLVYQRGQELGYWT